MPLKQSLRELLDQGEFGRIAELASRRRRVLSGLVSLTFDSDPLIAWRAVEAMGGAAKAVAEQDPDSVREHVRRLLWLVTEESGGICWHAPEAMAETIRAVPGLLAEYPPIVAHFLVEMAEEDLEHFRIGVLWAIGRLGSLVGGHVDEVLHVIVPTLDDPDSQVRGMAVWCLGRVGRVEPLADRPGLVADDGAVELYQDGAIERTSVSLLAAEALGSVSAP